MPVDLVIEEHENGPCIIGTASAGAVAVGAGGGGGQKPPGTHSPDSPGFNDHDQVGRNTAQLFLHIDSLYLSAS